MISYPRPILISPLSIFAMRSGRFSWISSAQAIDVALIPTVAATIAAVVRRNLFGISSCFVATAKLPQICGSLICDAFGVSIACFGVLGLFTMPCEA